MNSPLHLTIRVNSAGHRTVSGWSLTTPNGARPGIGRCYHIRRRPAPVRFVTTQEKILKNRPVPGRLLNSPVMCKSVKSYDVSFICDHSISKYACIGYWGKPINLIYNKLQMPYTITDRLKSISPIRSVRVWPLQRGSQRLLNMSVPPMVV